MRKLILIIAVLIYILICSTPLLAAYKVHSLYVFLSFPVGMFANYVFKEIVRVWGL